MDNSLTNKKLVRKFRGKFILNITEVIKNVPCYTNYIEWYKIEEYIEENKLVKIVYIPLNECDFREYGGYYFYEILKNSKVNLSIIDKELEGKIAKTLSGENQIPPNFYEEEFICNQLEPINCWGEIGYRADFVKVAPIELTIDDFIYTDKQNENLI